MWPDPSIRRVSVHGQRPNDANGNNTVTTTPAPAGQTGYETTTYTYDGAGNLIETVAPPTSSATGAQTKIHTTPTTRAAS
jgi:YD repeat-containing protein